MANAVASWCVLGLCALAIALWGWPAFWALLGLFVAIAAALWWSHVRDWLRWRRCA